MAKWKKKINQKDVCFFFVRYKTLKFFIQVSFSLEYGKVRDHIPYSTLLMKIHVEKFKSLHEYLFHIIIYLNPFHIFFPDCGAAIKSNNNFESKKKHAANV